MSAFETCPVKVAAAFAACHASFAMPIEPIAVADAAAWSNGDVIGRATGTFPGFRCGRVATIAGPMLADGVVLVVAATQAPCWVPPYAVVGGAS